GGATKLKGFSHSASSHARVQTSPPCIERVRTFSVVIEAKSCASSGEWVKLPRFLDCVCFEALFSFARHSCQALTENPRHARIPRACAKHPNRHARNGLVGPPPSGLRRTQTRAPRQTGTRWSQSR